MAPALLRIRPGAVLSVIRGRKLIMAFEPAVPVYSATRYHRPISSWEDYVALKSSWIDTAESVMKESYHIMKNSIADGNKPENYTGVIEGLNATVPFITFTVNSPFAGYYPDMIDGIDDQFMEENYDEDYTAAEDVDKRNWSVALKGILDPTQGADKFFRLVIKNDRCVLSGFKNLDTMDAVQSWCLDQEVLNIEPNGA